MADYYDDPNFIQPSPNLIGTGWATIGRKLGGWLPSLETVKDWVPGPRLPKTPMDVAQPTDAPQTPMDVAPASLDLSPAYNWASNAAKGIGNFAGPAAMGAMGLGPGASPTPPRTGLPMQADTPLPKTPLQTALVPGYGQVHGYATPLGDTFVPGHGSASGGFWPNRITPMDVYGQAQLLGAKAASGQIDHAAVGPGVSGMAQAYLQQQQQPQEMMKSQAALTDAAARQMSAQKEPTGQQKLLFGLIGGGAKPTEVVDLLKQVPGAEAMLDSKTTAADKAKVEAQAIAKEKLDSILGAAVGPKATSLDVGNLLRAYRAGSLSPQERMDLANKLGSNMAIGGREGVINSLGAALADAMSTAGAETAGGGKYKYRQESPSLFVRQHVLTGPGGTQKFNPYMFSNPLKNLTGYKTAAEQDIPTLMELIDAIAGKQ